MKHAKLTPLTGGSRMITLNTPAASLLKAAADAAADKLSRETGLRVSRHAVLLAAVRSGLAKMLDVDITDFDDPIPGFGNVPEEAGPADLR